jgi:N-acetylglucosaminyldiphosphoundecaprenol N-acetyl-beta-D-mannosaminyltransferase|tara:strand:- start:521 stop:1249 length:729 start_codon:yes stop_codon:yes gene_type:complete
MPKYFNINFEFKHKKVDDVIFNNIVEKKAGYVCSLDGNNIATANTNSDHLAVLNGAIVNNCDSSWMPVLINLIYGKKYSNYCGTDLFIKYVRLKKFKQFFLGSTPEILDKLKENLTKIDPKIEDMSFKTLPFKKVNEFDYPAIAKMINEANPDIIWVSLGAPKQEKFMSLLLPYLDKGIMFGFGAIFNVFAEIKGLKRAPNFLVKMKLEWLYRITQEPSKQIKRNLFVLSVLPKMLRSELKK